MSAKQFLIWEAYYQIAPFGEWRDDVRSAQIAAMVFNMAVDAKNRKPLRDFMLPWEKLLKSAEDEPPARHQTWQEKLAFAKLWVKAYNSAIEARPQ